MSAAHPLWNFKHLSNLIATLPPWRPNHAVDIIVAYGSHAPGVSIQDSAYNLQAINHYTIAIKPLESEHEVWLKSMKLTLHLVPAISL